MRPIIDGDYKCCDTQEKLEEDMKDRCNQWVLASQKKEIHMNTSVIRKPWS